MIEYQGMQFQVVLRFDGQYYCRIYKHGIPGPIFFTDDFITEKDAIASAKAIIQDHRAMTGEL